MSGGVICRIEVERVIIVTRVGLGGTVRSRLTHVSESLLYQVPR